MLVDLNRDEPYFDRNIPVTITSSSNDTHIINLTFRIIGGIKQNKNEKIIHFEFANDNDLYYLYLLEVCESDFHLLKREQSILVEFNVFPTKLIELIELSLLSDNNKSNSSTNQSTFTVHLNESTGIFSVVESNMFKQLTHISLQLRPGNDSAIKAYLASRLSYISNVSKQLTRDLELTRETLANEQNSYRLLSTETQELRYVYVYNTCIIHTLMHIPHNNITHILYSFYTCIKHIHTHYRSNRDMDITSIQSKHSEEISHMRIEALQEVEKLRLVHEVEVRSVTRISVYCLV